MPEDVINQNVINIVCVDDNLDIVSLIKAIVGSQPDMRIAHCFIDARSALDYLERVCSGQFDEPPPDVVLMDWSMPGMSGEQAIEKISQCWCDIRVLVVSAHHGTVLLDRALNAGAWGVICKTDGPSAILNAIRDVVSGNIVGEPG